MVCLDIPSIISTNLIVYINKIHINIHNAGNFKPISLELKTLIRKNNNKQLA